MMAVAAREAKNHFGDLLDTAQREPVAISKNGRRVAVVISERDYQRFEALEDAALAARADEAVRSGEWLGTEESRRVIEELLPNAGA